MRRIAILCVVSGIGLVSPAWAQSDSEAVEEELAPGEPEVADEAMADEEFVDDGEDVVVDIADEGLDVQLSLNMYGNVAALFLGSSEHDEEFGFIIGALGTVFTADVGENVNALAEIAFETAADGPIADIERVQLTYTRDQFFLQAGRMHSEIGFWNTAYHHGLWLQLPAVRPAVLRFEDDGGLLPVHHIGVLAGVNRPLGEDGALHLIAGFSNGRGDFVDDVPVTGDNGVAKAFLVSGNVRGIGVPDLILGGAFFYDKIPAVAGGLRDRLPDDAINEVIVNAHAAYSGDKVTFIAELFDIAHSGGGDSWNTVAAFALAGYTIGKFTPYSIVEVRFAPDESNPDPYFTPCADPDACALVPVDPETQIDFIEPAIGVRYKLGHANVLKLEYRLNRAFDAHDLHQSVALDWSFGI